MISNMAPLFRDKLGTTVAFTRLGRGGVVLLCSPWAISNSGIGSGDNLVLILNALNHQDRTRRLAVMFDEYHQGYGGRPGIMSLIGTPARLGLMQLGLAFVVLVFAVSRRFGRPAPLSEGGRQRSEYLSSMSALLRSAHATGVVRSELGRKFLEDSAVALGLPPNADGDMIVEAATRRRPYKARELRELVDAATASPQDRTDESALLALAGRWHQMRKDLMKTR